jgi:uncharacterized membrane protein (UPF0127 family)
MKVEVNGKILSHELKIASSFFSRLIGLMFKKGMQGYDGLLIKQCNSIHTFFMFFTIDAIFLNKNNEVIKIYRNLKPWRMTRIVWRASQCLELNGGTIPDNLKEGDSLSICTN